MNNYNITYVSYYFMIKRKTDCINSFQGLKECMQSIKL